jgi:inhibitor of KinA sporulation pathway (predicted exonuclease)
MKNYIILDIESTCWDKYDYNNSHNVSEIIEIGAVKLNENLEMIGEFDEFIKPQIHPILSDFCTNLTSINQEQIDSAQGFYDVMDKFVMWVFKNSGDIKFGSWGFYDKKKILNECEHKRLKSSIFMSSFAKNHISIKHQFADIHNMPPCGMGEALNMLNIPLTGTHHRGIDDAKNIFKIFINIFDKLKF